MCLYFWEIRFRQFCSLWKPLLSILPQKAKKQLLIFSSVFRRCVHLAISRENKEKVLAYGSQDQFIFEVVAT